MGHKGDGGWKSITYNTAAAILSAQYNIEVSADNIENRVKTWKRFYAVVRFGIDWCGSSTPRTPEYRTMNEERHERKAYWLVIVRLKFLTGGDTKGLCPSIP
ncbi:hypothetical protein L3X38_010469 [Prunus dulcis]|uniref:Uncharacterized protein n=1 Tax=Prunus dulcis TaxID=3755 RepID=A0AAD4ZE66_PRUDU|nr:hypothetical protein L3X38_010469 [Prunus dulcis]